MISTILPEKKVMLEIIRIFYPFVSFLLLQQEIFNIILLRTSSKLHSRRKLVKFVSEIPNLREKKTLTFQTKQALVSLKK